VSLGRQFPLQSETDRIEHVDLLARTQYALLMQAAPRRLAAFIAGNSLLLPVGAVTALVWANTAPDLYSRFASRGHFIVNDVGMTLFFALAAKEIIEATLPHGALHPMSKAATAVIGAIGGMLVPAAMYLGLVTAMDLVELRRGWAIPTATDIAFSFLIARWVFGRTHPAVPFLLLLAIADDAFGLIVLAVFYPTDAVRPIAFVVILSRARALLGIPPCAGDAVLAVRRGRRRVVVDRVLPRRVASGAGAGADRSLRAARAA